MQHRLMKKLNKILVKRIRLIVFFRIHFTYDIKFLSLPVLHLLKYALPFTRVPNVYMS